MEVVFVHNRESLSQIQKHLTEQGHRVAVLHGRHGGKEKADIVQQFYPPNGNEAERKYDILVMSDAGAAGVNLQNAKYLVNFDLPDTSWVKEQREGRIDRHGQAHSEIDYHYQTKLERIKRKAELGTIFQQDLNTLDDRGLLSYLHKAKQEQQNELGGLF